MNAPQKFPAVTGWNNASLRQAHALIERVYSSIDPESDAASAVWEAMEAVEAADGEVR